MKKKIIAILLITVLLVIAGCGKKEVKPVEVPTTEIVGSEAPKPVEPVEKKPVEPVNEVVKEAVPVMNTTNVTKPSTVYNKPTGLASVADNSQLNVTPVDCPTVTVQTGLRINAPVPDEFGVNKFIINENNMDRFTFSDSWILMKKTQITCKENGEVYNCEPFVIQKYVLDQYMSIKGLDYIQFYTFNINVFDIKLDRDPLSDKMVNKASFSLDKLECTKYLPKKT